MVHWYLVKLFMMPARKIHMNKKQFKEIISTLSDEISKDCFSYTKKIMKRKIDPIFEKFNGTDPVYLISLNPSIVYSVLISFNVNFIIAILEYFKKLNLESLPADKIINDILREVNKEVKLYEDIQGKLN